MIIFMFGIVLTLVLFIAMGFVRGEGMSWRVNKKQLLALVGVLVIVFSCYVSIPAGHTGVVTTFGSVENYTLEAGMHFKLPWQEVIKMDNRVQKSTQTRSLPRASRSRSRSLRPSIRPRTLSPAAA